MLPVCCGLKLKDVWKILNHKKHIDINAIDLF
jgi:hypothetical protein